MVLMLPGGFKSVCTYVCVIYLLLLFFKKIVLKLFAEMKAMSTPLLLHTCSPLHLFST